MHTTDQLLDLAKTRHRLPSDYKLGLTLGLASDSAISNYRKGRSHPDDEVGRKLAELAELDPGYVLACIHAQRAASTETRALWRQVAERLAGASSTAAAVILSALLGVSFTPDAGAMARNSAPMAAGSPTMPAPLHSAGLYIVHSSRRVLWRLLRLLSSPLERMQPHTA